MPKTSAFDDAWSMLKALPEQQMLGASMHPAIQGMLARRGRYPRSYGHHVDVEYPSGTLIESEGGTEYLDTDEGTVPVNLRAPDFPVRSEREIEPARVVVSATRQKYGRTDPRRFQGDLDPRQMRRGSLFDYDNPEPIVPLYPSAFPDPAEGPQFGEKGYEEGFY
jgi:hypothetical protein